MLNELSDVALYTSRDYTTRRINLNLNWLAALLAGFPTVCRLAAWLFWWLPVLLFFFLIRCFAG
jgi:hypothetical protein